MNVPATHIPEVSTAHLRLESLEKSYGAFRAVKALDLQVNRGEFLGFLGPSGCGKSTTLRMIGGLIAHTSGRIIVDGKDISSLPSHQRNMGIVFQNYALFPHMTVEENVGFGLRMRNWPAARIRERTAKMLETVHLGGYGNRKINDMSGGQQQRVALARALAIEPAVLLLDEPLSNLDAKLREAMRSEIREIQLASGITTIFVTHDQTEALAICDRVAVMRDGHIEQIGSASDIYERPATSFVADFVGRINRLESIQNDDGIVRVGETHVAMRKAPSGPIATLIRPHRVQLFDASTSTTTGHGFEGRIKSVSYLGDVTQYLIASGLGLISAERSSIGNERRYAVGDPVKFGWDADDMMFFPTEGPKQ